MKTNWRSLNAKILAGATIALLLIILAANPQSALAQTNTFPSSGNVGVGTTSPTGPLHVSTAATVSELLKIESTTNNSNVVIGLKDGSPGQTRAMGLNFINSSDSAQGQIAFFNSATAASQYMRFNTAGTERMRIDGSGNVGIGTSPTLGKLQVAGMIGNTSAVFGSDGTGVGLIQNWGQIGFNTYHNGGFKSINTGYGGTIGVDQGTGGIFFRTADSVTGAGIGQTQIERMRIDNAGKVGIGTATPSTKLQVDIADNETSWAGTQAQYALRLSNTGTTNNNWAQLTFWSSASSAAWVGAQFVNQSSAYADLVFATRGSASVGERMRITSSGNVGIGKSPTYPLDVNGDINATGFRINGTPISTGGSSQWTGSSTIYYNGGNVGIGTPSPNSKLEVAGNISVTGTGNITAVGTIEGGNIKAKYQDVAEWVPSSEQLPAATVVVLDTTKSNQVVRSTQAYDTRVAGVISEQPGIALGESGAGRVLVATTGRVRVKVDASRAPIQIGDLLVTSDMPGVAMKSEAVNLGGVQFHRPGTLIGKALEPLAKGSGEILVLLSLQ